MRIKLALLIIIAFGAISANAQTKQEADSIYQLGREVEDPKESRLHIQQAMVIYKSLYGEVSDDYINALNLFAISFSKEEDYKNAVKWEQQVLDLCDKLDHEHPKIGLFTENMGYFCYMTHDYPKATQYWERALPYEEKYSDKYTIMVQAMAMMYDEMGDSDNLSRMMQLMDSHNKHELSLPCEELKCMMERAEYYAGTGDNTQAKEWYLKAISIAKDEEKIQVCESYGYFLAMTMRDYTGAEYMLAAANLRKERDGENEAYINDLEKAGAFYFLGNQYQQAIDCYLPIITFYQQLDSQAAKRSLARCQKNLGNAYSGLKNFEKAKEYFQQTVAYYKTYDDNNTEYPKAILRLAKVETFNKDYEASIKHLQQAMELFEEHDMMEEYSDAASSLQLCYTYAGMDVEVDIKDYKVKAARNRQLDQSIKELKDDLEITKKYLGGMAYASTLSIIAGCYYLKEDYKQAVEYYQRYMPELRNAIRTEFQLQSEAERMASWNQEKDNLEDLKAMLFDIPDDNESLKKDLAALVYDAALLSKGILLNSSIEFEKVLAKQGNEELKSAYAQIKANEERLEWLRNNAVSDVDLDRILQLSQESQALLSQLYKGCKELADFTDYISYDWHDVKNALETNDIAIEFLTVQSSLLDAQNHMIAIVLTKSTPNPVAIPICTLAETKAMTSFEQLFELNNLVWGNLSQLLQNKNRVFFSADGDFNQIGIEYLKYKGKPFSEQFEVYRLSSTKELCYRHRTLPMKTIALFGNIEYNEESSGMMATQNNVFTSNAQIDFYFNKDFFFQNLKSTKQEINEIETIFNDKVKTIAKFTGTDASRAAFLNLNDSQVNLIHIATHCSHIEIEETTGNTSTKKSILAFAGANLYDDTHDGIVTNDDITKMDLHQCDLVVVSSECQFDLQLSFKNAGVHTLLMGISQLYDAQTANLMISFYRHLAEGNTKREALAKAQQEIRANGYTDAKYWATFILLDALE